MTIKERVNKMHIKLILRLIIWLVMFLAFVVLALLFMLYMVMLNTEYGGAGHIYAMIGIAGAAIIIFGGAVATYIYKVME